MDLTQLGWLQYQRKQTLADLGTDPSIGRVGIEHKTNWILHTEDGDLQGIIQGKFRHNSKGPGDFPKVGDWVVYDKLAGESKAIISTVLPRYALIARQAAGDTGESQIIAANVDVLFIVMGLDQEFNPPLLERYLTMAYEGDVTPIVILNKTDKTKYSSKITKQAVAMAPDVGVFPISAKSSLGLHKIEHLIEPGRTIAFVGPSGAGKSTLINALLGSEKAATGEVRLSDGKGRHTTTHREMFLLASGGILIDTPGIRELETLGTEDSVRTMFADIERLAADCRFKDCDHQFSKGCAVVAALEKGQITKQRYQSYLKQIGEAELHGTAMRWKREKVNKRLRRAANQVVRKSGRRKVN